MVALVGSDLIKMGIAVQVNLFVSSARLLCQKLGDLAKSNIFHRVRPRLPSTR